MEQQKKYYAFISYQRKDEKWAKWLQRKLEHYKFPTNLNGLTNLPKNIRPTFRDVTDLSPMPLEQAINNALRNSQWLIVVCSPRSAKSPWVCKEAQTFIDLDRADHIIPFVIEGIPFSSNPATECYPEALLNLTGSKELLAANVSEMGRDAAAVKVVARMFNIEFDTLWQRYNRELKRKRLLKSGGVLLMLIVLIAMGWLSYNNLCNNAKEVAKKALALEDMGDSFAARRMLKKVIKPYYPNILEVEFALRKVMAHDNTILYSNKRLSNINDMAFDRKGDYLAVAGVNFVDVWDLRNGEKKELALENKDVSRISAISRVKFYPDTVKNLIVTAYWDGSIVFRDAFTGKESFAFRDSHHKVLDICFNKDGSKMLSSYYNDSLIIHDVLRRKILKRISVPNMSQCINFNLKEDKAIFACPDYLYILDVNTGNFHRIPHNHKCLWISSVSYSKDEKYVVTSSDNGECIIRETKAFNCLDKFDGKFACFLPDESMILYASRNNMIKKRNVVSKIHVDSIPLKNIKLSSFLLSPDGNKLAISDDENLSIRIIDIHHQKSVKKLKGASDYTSYIAVDAKHGRLIYPTREERLGLWNLNTLDSIRTFDTKGVRSASFNPDGKEVAVVRDSTIQIFDIFTGNEKFILNDTCHLDKIAYSNDGRHLITGSKRFNILKLWDVNNKKCEQNVFSWINDDFWHWFNPIIFHHPTKEIIFTISNFGDFISIWNYNNKTEVERFSQNSGDEHKGHINNITFNSKGTYMASASADKSVKIWDTNNKTLKCTLLHSASVESLCFIQDDQIATSDANGNISVWDLSSETCIFNQNYTKPAIKLYYSNDILVGVSHDGYLIKCPYYKLCELEKKLADW